jgi:hypothetical protein
MGRPVLLSKIGGPGAASARMPRRWATSGSSGPGFSSMSPHVKRLPRPVKGTLQELRIVGQMCAFMFFVDSAMNPQRKHVVEDGPSAHWSAQLCCLAHSEGLAKSIGEVAGEGPACGGGAQVSEAGGRWWWPLPEVAESLKKWGRVWPWDFALWQKSFIKVDCFGLRPFSLSYFHSALSSFTPPPLPQALSFPSPSDSLRQSPAALSASSPSRSPLPLPPPTPSDHITKWIMDSSLRAHRRHLLHPPTRQTAASTLSSIFSRAGPWVNLGQAQCGLRMAV